MTRSYAIGGRAYICFFFRIKTHHAGQHPPGQVFYVSLIPMSKLFPRVSAVKRAGKYSLRIDFTAKDVRCHLIRSRRAAD